MKNALNYKVIFITLISIVVILACSVDEEEEADSLNLVLLHTNSIITDAEVYLYDGPSCELKISTVSNTKGGVTVDKMKAAEYIVVALKNGNLYSRRLLLCGDN